MEERTIKINIHTARKWYNSGDDSLKDLALQAFNMNELEKYELPMTWEEYCTNFDKRINSKFDASAIIPLRHLLVLRDVYRQGWKPDWTDSDNSKWVIMFENDLFQIDNFYTNAGLFSFPTKELAEQFLENFKDDLEKLKQLL